MVIEPGFQQLKHNMYSIFQVVFKTCQQLRHAGLNKASNTQPVSE